MKYIGLQAQKSNNNTKSIVLLVMFPVLILALVYIFFLILSGGNFADSNGPFLQVSPYVLGVVAVWFVIAFFANTFIINRSTGSQPLQRKDNKRIYNLVENLCMANGMPMPKVNVIYDNSLNAFASGINTRSYTVTLSKGIIDTLDDDELEGVIAHELSHIRNHDVRLLIVSIVFVGIFSFVMNILLRGLLHTPSKRNSKSKDDGMAIILVLLALSAIGYLFALLFKFAISRKREYLADAGAAEMTKKPQALASALRKISVDSRIEAVTKEDVAQLFIEHPGAKGKGTGLFGLFATHPPIEKRIQVLEQF